MILEDRRLTERDLVEALESNISADNTLSQIAKHFL